MKNDYFLKYFLERDFDEIQQTKSPGPVITIARDFGCYSSHIADMLADRLNELPGNGQKWRWLSNEILAEAAHSLEVDPSRISHIFGAEERPFLHDIVESLSAKKYVCDSNIKKTIERVVRKYAEKGNVIVVGRAGCVITSNIERALHVKFIAPFEWRVNRIQERLELPAEAARKKVLEVDERRKTFMSFYGGDKADCEMFDAIFNRAHMSEEEIVESIVCTIKLRKLM